MEYFIKFPSPGRSLRNQALRDPQLNAADPINDLRQVHRSGARKEWSSVYWSRGFRESTVVTRKLKTITRDHMCSNHLAISPRIFCWPSVFGLWGEGISCSGSLVVDVMCLEVMDRTPHFYAPKTCTGYISEVSCWGWTT